MGNPSSAPSERAYAASLISYNKGGKIPYAEFYARYGIHQQLTFAPNQPGAAVGKVDAALEIVDQVQIAYMYDPSQFQSYIQDPDYPAIRPIRVDSADQLYTFFMGPETTP